MTMFNDRLTRNRLKSPNYTKSPVTGYIFLPVSRSHIYICVVYDASPRLEPLAFDIALINDITETEVLLIISFMLSAIMVTMVSPGKREW
jgi:hypothetical protein